ncbi:multisite-specific tRNA:(cytosine-C(5))-methyltransferase-like, partial [Tubulinosema ratisbonensis]
MCSAPGSKTTQLINLTNFLVANEPNNKRRNVLVTNTSKFTTNNLVITTYDARYFPLQIKFDRILCDVPCSSDGTIRKDPSILFDWSISKSKGISQLQLQILRRGLKLLKDDGILVYSTCTFNQLENENVLEEALTEEYEIINVNDSLQGLCFTNGNTFKTKNAVRILPNGEDTGGFFISVIRKKIISNANLTDHSN